MTDNKINQYAAFISSQIDKSDIKEAVEQVDEGNPENKLKKNILPIAWKDVQFNLLNL